MFRSFFSAAILVIMLGVADSASAQGQILIYNNNLPGVGFNDPTPAAPVGGNPGTTLGQQRINVFLRAAEIWENRVNPTVDVLVLAQFTALGTNVLGSAGARTVFRDFPGAEFPGTWYPEALANKLAGFDLQPCPVLALSCFDLTANFATTFNFYMGLDNNEGPGQQDLLAVILHELGHGLGFANFENESTGEFLVGFPDVYSQYTVDVETNKGWPEMTIAERIASAINVRHVSWSGINVKKNVPTVLQPGEPAVNVVFPAIGPYPLGAASFGPPLTAAGVTGDVVLALDAADAAGPSTTDGCSTITNASAVSGRIALMDRGACGFTIKVKNAQDAGAIGVLIADNVLSEPAPGLGGVDPTITIPSGRVSLPDGNEIKANLPAVRLTLSIDTSVLAGTDRIQGLMMLASFNPVIGGSSISHFEGVAFPNQLMEPAINPDLTTSLDVPQDLTASLMTDIGWFSDQDGVPDGLDACLGSDLRPTVVIGTCDSGVANPLVSNGCTISDLIGNCAAKARNHGAFVSCVSNATNDLKKSGVITNGGKSSLQSCAAGAKIP
ncbi:MAG: PA domain-containing protein [Acidobacteriota bacterium]